MAMASVGAGLSELNSFVSDPHFKDYLGNFDIPKSVYIAIATLGLITWLAHGREHDA